MAELGHGVARHQLESAEAGDLGGRQVGFRHDHEVDELHLDQELGIIIIYYYYY